MTKICRIVFVFLVALFAVALGGCGGGGGGGGGAGLTTPAANISGTWQVDEGPADSSSNNCDDGTIYHYNVVITHSGTSNSFTLVEQTDFDSFSGTISGTNMSYSGTPANSDCPNGFSLAVSLALNASGKNVLATSL